MKKIIYGNIISIIMLIVLPWFFFIQEDSWDIINFDRNYLFIVVFIGVVLLIIANIKSAIQSKGGKRIASIIFVIPPVLVILYFILGYIAFSGYSILG